LIPDVSIGVLDSGRNNMHLRSRIPLVIGVIAATAALGVAPALGGGAKRFKSTVTLAQTNPFHGQVNSHKSACEVSRTVTVYQAVYSGDSSTTRRPPAPTTSGRYPRRGTATSTPR
jgi:hypothetical protein